MTAADVIEIVELLDRNHIDVCVDGGWGVDALLGGQTRPHADLDLAIQHKDVTATRALLESRGFKDVPRDDTRDCNFVLGDDRGRLIDIHTYTFDSAGKLVYGIAYPFELAERDRFGSWRPGQMYSAGMDGEVPHRVPAR